LSRYNETADRETSAYPLSLTGVSRVIVREGLVA
jgi:hypothetical protein